MLSPSPKNDPVAAAQPLALRPLARVERVALYERVVRERLSPAALELIFACAEVMSEGQPPSRERKEPYFGSTLLTIDVKSLSGLVRDPCDAGTAKRLATLLAAETAVSSRVKAIASREAARISGGTPGKLATVVKVRSRGTRIFIDVDVEGTP